MPAASRLPGSFAERVAHGACGPGVDQDRLVSALHRKGVDRGGKCLGVVEVLFHQRVVSRGVDADQGVRSDVEASVAEAGHGDVAHGKALHRGNLPGRCAMGRGEGRHGTGGHAETRERGGGQKVTSKHESDSLSVMDPRRCYPIRRDGIATFFANVFVEPDFQEGGAGMADSDPITGLSLPRGARVGLLGGSFDPAHDGHAHITREALKRFGLDRVVWLVSPGNPLKTRGPAPLGERLAAARQVMQHPRVIVSDAEARLGTRYTAQTLAELRARHSGVRFVWLMGADNLRQLHRWDNWRAIMDQVPVGVLARPGVRMSAQTSVAARVYASARIGQAASHLLPLTAPPAWCFLNVPMMDVSSSAIRATGEWKTR